MALVVSLLVLNGILSAECFILKIPHISSSYSANEDSGSPLFLTPFIESGKIEEAKKLARVNLPGLPDLESYAGFFTVNKNYNSNNFFWYFPPTQPSNKTMSTIVWLQGGPGVSSLYGLLEENGPILVSNGKFQRRKVPHWAERNHVIYIDNPVGTGFSFTDNGYCTNQTVIGEQLYTTLYQFYQMFPALLKVQLFVSGESYGGKYAPALAYTIHKKNPTAKVQGGPVLPLKGLTIGNGWCDPINQLSNADLAYQIGVISGKQREQIKVYENDVRDLIKQKKWRSAFVAWVKMIVSIEECMGLISIYDYAEVVPTDVMHCTLCDLLNSKDTRKAIHVGNLTYNYFNIDVYLNLLDDFMQSVSPWIAELLEHYYMLTYNGHQDIMAAYPLTTNFLRQLNWSGKQQYENATRFGMSILVNGKFESMGYFKPTKNLWEFMITGAGHMAPRNRPLITAVLLDLFSNHKNTSELANVDYDQLVFIPIKNEPSFFN